MGGGFEAAILTVVNLRQMGIKQIYARAEKGKIINVPMPGTVVYQGDILMVAGSDADFAKLPQE
jgi:Trk K+ transport system NAD-binding subunit